MTECTHLYHLYRQQREHQSLQYVGHMLKTYCWEDFDGRPAMSVTLSLWDSIRALGDFRKVSVNHKTDTHPEEIHDSGSETDINSGTDIDSKTTDECSTLDHAFYAAETMRIAGKPEWMQLVALLLGLGKIIYLKGNDHDGTSCAQQWGIVGDSFIVGYPLADVLPFSELNQVFPQTQLAHYKPGCGFERCHFSFGQGEYLWRALHNNHTLGRINLRRLPLQALYVLRYHSFTAWSTHGAYSELADDWDREMLPWLREFSAIPAPLEKSHLETRDIEVLRPYYETLFHRFLGCKGDTPLQW